MSALVGGGRILLRPGKACIVIALLILVGAAQVASAQDEGFLRLGEDPRGDPNLAGAPYPDTMADILYLDVNADEENIIFDLGLAGTSTEIGVLCPTVAFTFGGTNYLAFDCFECVANQCTNAVSGVNPPGSSRGANVAGSVVFTDAAARITVPLSNINAKHGDIIDNTYGLMYATRALSVVDAAPDAKRSANAEESFGAYAIGFGRPEDLPTVPEARTVFENLTTARIDQSYTNATSDTFVFNWTAPSSALNLTYGAAVENGSFELTILDGDGITLLQQTVNESFETADLLEGAAPGNWTITIGYSDFVGSFFLNITQVEEVEVHVDLDHEEESVPVHSDDGEEKKGLPGFGVLALLAGLGVALTVRRRL
jgi:hypothetical protein